MQGWSVALSLSSQYYFTNPSAAFIEGDPVDVALSWAADSNIEGEIPVISMANDKRPGGDWEASS